MNSEFLKKEALRFKVKVGVFLFLIEQERVLLLRRYNTGIDDGCYVVPMGGLNEGETVTQAVIREAQEEAGVQITADDVEVCHVMHRFHQMPSGYNFPQIDLFFKARRWEGKIANCEPHKCDELEFYSLKALPEKTVPFISQALQCAQQGVFYSEFGWTLSTMR